MPEPPPSLPPGLPLTGERTMPDVWQENYWFRRHEVVYAAVARFAGGARVLDAGCGEGYGAGRLAAVAASVVALDYDAASIAHAAATYDRISAVRGNLVQLPFADASFDLVVSLQTIEHLWDQPAFVAECARVTRPTGRVVLSTPNRHTFPPGNTCHHRELDADELRDLLRPALRIETLRGLRHGPRLRQWERMHGSLPTAQIAGPPDSWPADLTELVRDVRTDDFRWHIDDLRSTLDLVAVCRPA